jgi:OPA family glycerol-3-phosphate transporter-like MFS transporter
VSATAAPSGRLKQWQDINIALLVAGYSGYYLCRSNLSVTMPLLIAELERRGISAAAAQVMLGTVASYGVLAYAIGKFPSGNLADRIGGKRNFLSGMGGSVAFTVLFAISGALPAFTLAWIGNRLSQSLGWAGAVKIVSRWFPRRQYGTVMALISLSYLFGDAAARQFLAWLISLGWGWRVVFLISAGVVAMLLWICAGVLREAPSEVGEPEPEDDAGLFAGCSGAARTTGLRGMVAPFLASRAFWLACALSLGTTLLRETFNLWTPTFFSQSAGMTSADAARASAVFPLFGGVSVLLCGWLSDRLGRGGRAALMLIGLMLAGVSLLALRSTAVASSREATVILVGAVAFLILGPYSFLAGAISLDFGGKSGAGTASGLIDGIGYLGGVLSGGGMASISVRYGWNGAFLLLAAVAVLSSVAAGLMLRQIMVTTNGLHRNDPDGV